MSFSFFSCTLMSIKVSQCLPCNQTSFNTFQCLSVCLIISLNSLSFISVSFNVLKRSFNFCQFFSMFFTSSNVFQYLSVSPGHPPSFNFFLFFQFLSLYFNVFQSLLISFYVFQFLFMSFNFCKCFNVFQLFPCLYMHSKFLQRHAMPLIFVSFNCCQFSLSFIHILALSDCSVYRLTCFWYMQKLQRALF